MNSKCAFDKSYAGFKELPLSAFSLTDRGYMYWSGGKASLFPSGSSFFGSSGILLMLFVINSTKRRSVPQRIKRGRKNTLKIKR